MKKISLLLMLVLFFFSSKSMSQDLVEKNDYKYFRTSYDKENFILRRINDTLHVFIQDEKKISFFWADISLHNGFPSFEDDIDEFLKILASLKLPTATESYSIRYSPNSNQINFRPLEDIRFRKTDGEVYPIKTQEVRFSYVAGMMDVIFYLGEIDELLVLKEARISEMVKKIWEEKAWMSQYRHRRLNKELHLLSDGRKELITYSNLDSKSRFLTFDVNVGASIIANQLPITTDIIFALNNGKIRKWTGMPSSSWELSFKTYSFVQYSAESGFNYLGDSFINGGYSFNGIGRTTIKYGRKVNPFRQNSFLDSINNRVAIDFDINTPFIFTLDYFFNREEAIPSIGIKYKF